MKRRSPTIEGFRTIFRLPALGLAEIAWRWSFGFALTALFAFSFREYLSTLPVTASEMFLLRTGQPVLVLQAISRILQGSAPRVVVSIIVISLALTLAWIMLASLGRAAVLKTLLDHFRNLDHFKNEDNPTPRRWRLSSLIGLNFLRAASVLAALASLVGAVVVAGAASSETNPAPGSAMLIFWMLTMFTGFAWAMLNWFLSLAAIFVVSDGRTSFGALKAVADLWRSRTGAVIAVSAWFGAAHSVAFVIASSVVAFPLAFIQLIPGPMVLGGIIFLSLVYFAIADFLYVGRLAAYVFLIEFPESTQPSAIGTQPARPASDDDILSDIPGLVPPPHPAAG
jgi:hypothetical protein